MNIKNKHKFRNFEEQRFGNYEPLSSRWYTVRKKCLILEKMGKLRCLSMDTNIKEISYFLD